MLASSTACRNHVSKSFLPGLDRYSYFLEGGKVDANRYVKHLEEILLPDIRDDDFFPATIWRHTAH